MTDSTLRSGVKSRRTFATLSTEFIRDLSAFHFFNAIGDLLEQQDFVNGADRAIQPMLYVMVFQDWMTD
ncbi:MAG TPA: hypothetical protein VK634_01055 [Reyranella sp.]|nr:hypothetical protein [Reyranella sp.]